VNDTITKLLADYGGMGVAFVLFWRLIDKWAGRFLEAQTQQTTAMAQQAAATGALAGAVKEGQADQREILMAVRLLADRIDQQKEYLIAIDERQRRAA